MVYGMVVMFLCGRMVRVVVVALLCDGVVVVFILQHSGGSCSCIISWW